MFLRVFRKGLYFNADGGAGGGAGAAGAGAGSAGATGVADQGAAGAGAAGAGAAGAGAAGAGDKGAPSFSWDALNLAPETKNIVDSHGWKDVNAAITSYANAQKLIGLKGQSPERVVVLPKDNDPPEAWNEVFKKLGRPDNAEGYELPVPEGQPKELAGNAARWFHELGIPKGAAQKLTERWNNFVKESTQAQQAKVQETHTQQVATLKAEWGADYNTNAGLVDKAAQTFGVTQEILAGLKQVMGPAATMKFFHLIGSKLGVEGKFIEGNEGGGGGALLSPAQAQAELKRLQSDPDFSKQWNSSTDPKARQEARDKLRRLQQQAYPGVTVQQ